MAFSFLVFMVMRTPQYIFGVASPHHTEEDGGVRITINCKKLNAISSLGQPNDGGHACRQWQQRMRRMCWEQERGRGVPGVVPRGESR